jgi:acetylornithine deacetylase/succinyl-diaminopimelate desuccinylase-like protein
MGSPSPQDLLAEARSRQDQMLALLRDLVCIPSVNGEHPETPVAERIAAEAEDLGFQVRILGPEPDRQNVLVEYGDGPRGFALLAHTDTVSPGPEEKWSSPPFGAHVEGTHLVGRGTADNKAGIACGLYAMAIVRDGGWCDPAAVRMILAGFADEESGASSPLGAKYLLEQGLLPVQAAIYTYASHIICLGHRGLIRLLLRASGQPVHSGSAEWTEGAVGVNAVTGLAEALLALEGRGLPSRPHPDFGNLDNHITPGTIIEGGDAPGMVPGWAEAVVDVRLMPGLPIEEALAHIDQTLEGVMAHRPGLHLGYEIQTALPAAHIPAGHRLVQSAKRYTSAILGDEWRAAAAGPANEGYLLIEAGIPTLCGFGPRGGNPHAPDEWISIEDLAPMAAIYSGMALEFLQGTGENDNG